MQTTLQTGGRVASVTPDPNQEQPMNSLWQNSIQELAGSPISTRFKNLVVGAGPAGFAVASTLLDGSSEPILWVDPEFMSGRLHSYLEVPSNTKAKLFTLYGTTFSHTSNNSSWATERMQVCLRLMDCRTLLYYTDTEQAR